MSDAQPSPTRSPVDGVVPGREGGVAHPSGAVGGRVVSDDVESSLGDLLYVETTYDDGTATIIVVGEFDMTGTARFWAAVSETLSARPASVSVEARGLTFIDSSGISALVRARDAAAEAGVAFGIREPSHPRFAASSSSWGSRRC